MRGTYNYRQRGAGKSPLFLLLILFFVVILVGWKAFSTEAPAIQLKRTLKGIGQSTPVELEITDPHNQIRSLKVEVLQSGRTFPVTQTSFTPAPRPWWKFWAKTPGARQSVSVQVGRKQVAELQEGRATLVITAKNDSWGRFFRGGQRELRLDLPVRLAPPRIDVLSPMHYVNQGGSEAVIFKVSPGTTESGVRVGNYFFPSWPLTDSAPETRFGLFAYPYDLPANTPIEIVARDDAGNETVANFNYRVFPKQFRSSTINLNDDFIARVVPPIVSQSPEVHDLGDPLKNFLEVNGKLRKIAEEKLIQFSHQTSPHLLWKQPFVQLGNSQVEASFADRRTYVYNGQKVDQQTHLGYDLAVTAHTPIVAANDGVVLYAAYFGIYGNAVIIDHGCGLQTLYGHLSSIQVKAGDRMQRGQVIGLSGQTGLAGGDHLHFSVLLDGIFVNPVEWWDAHWIHDRIEAKLARQ
ncbi:MAG: M23 family metallopeptidase [Terriglobales bacterium]